MLERIRNNRLVNWTLATKRRRIATSLLALLIVFGLVRNYLKPDWELETVSAKSRTLVESVTSSGNITAEKFAELSFLSSENIQNIVVEDNSSVYAGQVIAYLDRTSLIHSVAQAEADLRDQEAALEEVYDDLKGKDDTETFAEKAERTAAEVAKDKAYDALIIARKNLTNATITAPFDGIVTFKSGTSVGKYATPLTPAFYVVDPTTMFFEAELSEIDIPKIKPGTAVEIVLDAYPKETIDGEVESIGFVNTVSSTGGVAYKIKVVFPELSDDRLRIGMNGDADFILSERENILTVPQTAVVEDDEETYVWVVEGATVGKRLVETGTSSINNIEIVSGLEEGEIVISRPPADMAEGDRVKQI